MIWNPKAEIDNKQKTGIAIYLSNILPYIDTLLQIVQQSISLIKIIYVNYHSFSKQY